MGKAILETKKIHKNYGSETILEHISVVVESGSMLAITGPSGSGKTTLLSIMGLLQKASAGEVLVDGIAASQLSPKGQAALRRQYFGLIFQRARLISSLTAIENVLVPAWLARKEKAVVKKAQALLAHFGLANRMHHRPQELSLGQLRRVALARALLLEPPILLADEPTNDLDPIMANKVMDWLADARETGAAVIVVTHDPAMAARADHVVNLQQGRLVLADNQHEGNNNGG
ncbi:ABC transporter ATP-binding protein [Heliophilum fasciatum]|uniref:Lipoprotein-releasing system ATP-binding protein n=1 Tax=Heliophilum fasciatum TaxID=35700 RepID=A0A4R2RPA5_9FIRM|nr:ABC transporter ATP-binding protein [Heliophilum fasciatum]MCW2277696.1 ABC-type lipoprotein export system ATPase subunit [Heliophilum fasciatum]TCP65043.1 lipoprotein-releasing system ATP-binding protein [Heliophilum fasciatum]